MSIQRYEVEIALLEALKEWRKRVQTGHPGYQEKSLCFGASLIQTGGEEVLAVQARARHMMLGTAHYWPLHSGNPMYPVPSPYPGMDAVEVFMKPMEGVGFYSGEYGALRLELLDWLINRLEGVVRVDPTTMGYYTPEAVRELRQSLTGIFRELGMGHETATDSEEPEGWKLGRQYSLCGLIQDDMARRLMLDLAGHWPESSGDRQYPVPSPDRGRSAQTFYTHLVQARASMWDGEYGEARTRLLQWLDYQLGGENHVIVTKV